MIILVTYKDEQGQIMVDYGYNVDFDEIVILPQLPIFCVDHRFDVEIGEYILKNEH